MTASDAPLPDLRILRESEYYTLAVSRARRLLWITRTGKPFPALSTLQAENAALINAVGVFRGAGLVLDMRAARANNDPAFEEAMRTLRVGIGKVSPRVVVVVATASGEMQVSRLHRSEGLPYQVTRDLEHAVQLASGPSPDPIAPA